MNFEPVAIVSVECRLPGAATLDDFYRNNRNAVCSIREADESFWQGCEVYDKDDGGHINTSYTNLGGFLDPWEVARGTFRMAPKVLESMDPVHMLAMDLAKRAIDRCEAKAPLPREDTAVIIANVTGGTNSRIRANMSMETAHWAASARRREPALTEVLEIFQERVRQQYSNKRENLALNLESGTIGGRIANYFDLHGTHYGIDAACGSSLAAIHSACMGLHQEEFDAALVGGVGILTPDVFVLNSAAQTLSKDGSFPFGAKANGLIPGEGGVMMMLMRLGDARRAGRPVLGVIRSVGHSTNGRTTATWSPSAEAQERAIHSAFDGMPFGTADVDYVEAHGTSTYAGDGTEVAAMLGTYGTTERKHPLPFGSAKSLIGHTVESAGMVGMLRGLFLFKYENLPPTVNVEKARPEVEQASDRLQLQRDVAPVIGDPGRLLRVGVSAFGYGGVNYHLLMEEYAEHRRPPAPARRPRRVPIAITAMEVVAPDAPDIAAFWRNLRAGMASSRNLCDDVPDIDLYWEDPDLRKQAACLKKAALVDIPCQVDHRRFRILPKQVPGLTDEMLVLLSCASNLAAAIDTALADVDRERTGCIIGQLPESDREFELIQSLRFVPWLRSLRRFARSQGVEVPWAALRDEMWHDPGLRLRVVDQDTSVSGFGSTLASVLAGSFDLRGKSYAVRAACATGLAALSLGAQELRQRNLDFVLCGAVDMGLGLMNHSALAAIRALSSQGVGRPYDQDGDGFIMGGGAGLLCMKRLDDAERDGDDILAVLREVRGSSDGKGRSLLAPRAEGRQLAMERTYRSAGIDPASVSFVEGHGAATALGDRSEADALAASLGNRATVYLGSVKGNVGHQKAASGMTAVIKTVLCLKERQLVPTPGHNSPHSALSLEEKRFEVVKETRPWPSDGSAPLRAGVNAFGLAGINYHAVLEEYVPKTGCPRRPAEVRARADGPLTSRLWTAPDPRALAEKLSAFAERGEYTHDIAPGDACRLAVVTDEGTAGLEEARRRARLFLSSGEGADRYAQWDTMGVHMSGDFPARGKVCRLYPGQGSQYPGMLRDAASLIPGAEDTITEAAGCLADHVPDLRDGFWTYGPQKGQQWLSRTEHCQVATLVVSKVLGDWLTGLGVPADAHLGHSFGEVSALLGACCLSFPDALRTAYHRGRIAAGCWCDGRPQSMAVFFTSGARGSELIGENHEEVVIANWNSRSQIVMAGYADAVERVREQARASGIDGRLLPIERAFHSPLLAPAVAEYRTFLDTVAVNPPCAPVYETLTSRPYPHNPEPAHVRQSLAQQFTLPVYYETMIRDAYDRGSRIFIEVGPKKALSGLVGDILGAPSDVRTVTLLHPKGGEQAQLQRAWAQLWALGLTDVTPGRTVAESSTHDHAS